MEQLRCAGCGEIVTATGVHLSGLDSCAPAPSPCPGGTHRWTRITAIAAGMDLLECVTCGTWATPRV